MQLRLKANNGELLTADEEWRLESDFAALMASIEWEYEQFQSDRVSYLPVKGFRGALNRWPYMKSLWPEYRSRFSPEFARFMEEELLDQGEVTQ